MGVRNIYGIPMAVKSKARSHYAHFFMGVLIPLIYYDIATKHRHTLIIRTPVGSFASKLHELFPGRVIIDPSPEILAIVQDDSYGDMKAYFQIYVNLLQRMHSMDNETDVLLDACDIFGDGYFAQVRPNLRVNPKMFEQQERYFITIAQYVNHPYRVFQIKPTQKELPEDVKHAVKKLSVGYYLTAKFTQKYQHVAWYKQSINNYFHKIYPPSPYRSKVLLIDRPFTKFDDIPKDMPSTVFFGTSGQRRLIANHTELYKALKKTFPLPGDVVNVSLDKLSVQDQYYLFNQTTVIVAQHGAGLCNMMFTKSGFKTSVVEIAPKWIEDLTHWFVRLAQVCEVNHYFIKQPKMTELEWTAFLKKHKYNIKDYPYIGENPTGLNNVFYEMLYSFISNSGSVNIDAVISQVQQILDV